MLVRRMLVRSGRGLRLLFLVALLPLFAACASGPYADARDPLEPLNRGVSTVNHALDKALLRPVARGYTELTPGPVRTAVRNFFGNLRDILSIPNNLLQAKPRQGIEMTMRVIMNTVFGLGGMIDIASAARMPRHANDFGQTLGYWGVPSGPYLVLPLLGPSTVRDAVGRAVDIAAGLSGPIVQAAAQSQHTANVVSVGMLALDLVDTRARLMPTTDYAEKVATDLYTFTRDTWLQNRAASIREATLGDGNDEGDWTDSAASTDGAATTP